MQEILLQEMQLEKGSLRFEIANQYLAWGQFKKLIALPDAKGDNRFFTAFSRVISGRSDRTGCGATLAILQLEVQ